MVGLGDSQSEERVAAVVVLNPNKKTTMEDLLKWCNDNMEEAEVKSMVISVQIAPGQEIFRKIVQFQILAGTHSVQACRGDCEGEHRPRCQAQTC